jgi:hypothetical protein
MVSKFCSFGHNLSIEQATSLRIEQIVVART